MHRFKFWKLQIKKLENNKGQRTYQNESMNKKMWSITIELLVEKTHVNFNKQIIMKNVITLILDLWPNLRYKGGNGPRKCNKI